MFYFGSVYNLLSCMLCSVLNGCAIKNGGSEYVRCGGV